MRLIRTDTFKLEEYFDVNVPDYAILSHTWGQEEVSFRDMQDGKAREKAGYSKIEYAIDQAAADGHKYVWINTCCIDKASSAELSEAINSMYQWYKSAKICYAYLADVSWYHIPATHAPSSWYTQPDSAFARSRWFTRGWTLQELIAPSDVIFYDKDWNFLGTKLDLVTAISIITGVDVSVLDGSISPLALGIARRVSWAAERQTTRLEDIAYCLMGLFDVNMPLLYREGKKAFTRLQEEILKDSDDHSLFAWRAGASYNEENRGILAESPAEFAGSRDIIPFRDWRYSAPYSMTNKGLSLEKCVETVANKKIYIAGLNCRFGENQTNRVGIYVMCLEGDQYARIRPGIIVTTKKSMYDPEAIFIRKKLVMVNSNDTVRGYVFRINLPEHNWGYSLMTGYPDTRWDNDRRLLYPSNVEAGKAGVLRFGSWNGSGFVAILGRDYWNRGWCFLRNFSGHESLESFYHSFNTQDMLRKPKLAKICIEDQTIEVAASVIIEEVKGYTEYLVNFKIEQM